MPVGPLAVLDETSLALSVHVLDQTRADLAAEGKTFAPSPGEALVERMVKELGRAGPCRAAAASTTTRPASRSGSGRACKRHFEKRRRRRRHRRR